MVSAAIDKINKNLTELFGEIPNVKIYGLAQTVLRKQGTATEQIPAIVNKTGEAEYVGIDDKYGVIIYHKSNSIQAGFLAANTGYGDNKPRFKNTYQQSLIVYLDRRKLNYLPDEIFMFIQAHFPDPYKSDPFEINITIQNVVLSSTQTYANEYKKDYALPPEVSLFTVNYTVESSFKKSCFEKCLNC